MATLAAQIRGIGLLGPGLDDWAGGIAVFSGATPYVSRTTVLPTPSVLPAAERRRTGGVVKLALAISLEAVTRSGLKASELPTVFSSSGGDGSNCHEICQTLATDDRQISPTRFHNSVHNAASGYWSIAASATRAANVLCAYDASFGAGLLEALTQVVVERTPVLLVAYDVGYPEPLHAVRPIPDAFGLAMVLEPVGAASTADPQQVVARITASLTDAVAERMPDAQLEALRISIPAARGLPLLARLARRQPGCVVLDYLENQRIAVEVSECR
jgi:Beta-ketoacyl synthase, N-terminal domain